MNQTPSEQEQLKLALAQIADCHRTALNAIEATLKNARAAEEILETMRQHSLIVSPAIQ